MEDCDHWMITTKLMFRVLREPYIHTFQSIFYDDITAYKYADITRKLRKHTGYNFSLHPTILNDCLRKKKKMFINDNENNKEIAIFVC